LLSPNHSRATLKASRFVVVETRKTDEQKDVHLAHMPRTCGSLFSEMPSKSEDGKEEKKKVIN